jgi:hemerythrin-like domain-containing protein
MNIFSRRMFMAGAGLLGVDLLVNGCAKKGDSKEVTAVEDLMREHGVLRRALFIYSEAAISLRGNPLNVPPSTLQRTAKLFHSFGEEYHEKKLEEAYIFPAVKKAGGEAAAYPDILVTQHQRGREITDYVITVTKGDRIEGDSAIKLASVLESFVRMYRPHAASEDTIVFPAWKQALSAADLDEMNDKFEDIEREQFGEGGFEKAVHEIGDIEAELKLADLAQFTVSPPQTN